MMKCLIEGLILKPLRRFSSETGDFRELVRVTDDGFAGFSQLSTSVVFEGVTKAWHLHWDQTESMSNALGVVKFSFADRRPDSPTLGVVCDYLVDPIENPRLFTVPPGIAHGYRIIRGPALICYLANRIYDPKDQIKIAADDPEIGYDWGS